MKNSDFDNEIKKALPQVWLPYFKDDTPIILDMSDIAKSKALKTDCLAIVRDGLGEGSVPWERRRFNAGHISDCRRRHTIDAADKSGGEKC